MQNRPVGRRMFIAYVALYLAFAASSARAILELRQTDDFWYTVGLLAFYLVLLLATPWLIARNISFLHILNALQTAIALVLLIFVGEVDYFSLLFIPPCTQSILNFPRKTALTWIIGMTLLMITAQFISFPLAESIGYIIIYPTAIFLFTALSYLAQQAEQAQNRSEALLVDLRKANQQLLEYASQVQELTAINERNRLARELHDSVTQTIFGLTLSAQAARILVDRNPERAVKELDHLQSLAQSALAEMRALVQELRPHSAADQNLGVLLRKMAAERKLNDGLNVDLQIKGDHRLAGNIEPELFRVVQEALNNVVKHAHSDQAKVILDLEDTTSVHLLVEDNGVGFDPDVAKALPGHLGLTSIQERVEALGGKLAIDSQPGKGTRLRVDIALEKEENHAQ